MKNETNLLNIAHLLTDEIISQEFHEYGNEFFEHKVNGTEMSKVEEETQQLSTNEEKEEEKKQETPKKAYEMEAHQEVKIKKVASWANIKRPTEEVEETEVETVQEPIIDMNVHTAFNELIEENEDKTIEVEETKQQETKVTDMIDEMFETQEVVEIETDVNEYDEEDDEEDFETDYSFGNEENEDEQEIVEETEETEEVLDDNEYEELNAVGNKYDYNSMLVYITNMSSLADQVIPVYALEDTKEFYETKYSQSISDALLSSPEVGVIMESLKRYIEQEGREVTTYTSLVEFLEVEDIAVRGAFVTYVNEIYGQEDIETYREAVKFMFKRSKSSSYIKEKKNIDAHIETWFKANTITNAINLYSDKALEPTDDYNISLMNSAEIAEYWSNKSDTLKSFSSTNLKDISKITAVEESEKLVDELIKNTTNNLTGRKYKLESSPLLTEVLGGGLRKQTFTGFAAPSGVGKSKLAFNIAHDLAYGEGLNVLFITNELTKSQIKQHIQTVSINKMHRKLKKNDEVLQRTLYTELEPVKFDDMYTQVQEMLYTSTIDEYREALKSVKRHHKDEQIIHERNMKHLFDRTNEFMSRYSVNHKINKEVEIEILQETNENGENDKEIEELNELLQYETGNIIIVDYNEQGDKVLADIINEVNKGSRKLDAVIIDTLKADEREAKGKNKDNHLILKQMTQSIEVAVKKHSLIGIAMMQIADSENKKVTYDISSLAESKSAKDVMSTLIMFRNLREDERHEGDNQKTVRINVANEPVNYTLPKLKDDREKKELNQDLMLFKVVKNRFGNGDLEYILRADKGCNTFTDVGMVTYA